MDKGLEKAESMKVDDKTAAKRAVAMYHEEAHAHALTKDELLVANREIKRLTREYKKMYQAMLLLDDSGTSPRVANVAIARMASKDWKNFNT